MLDRYRRIAAVRLLLVAVLSVVCSPSAHAGSWTVSADGSGSFRSVQAAVNAAASGDTVRVTPGLYIGPIWIEGKNIFLISTGGPEVTILDSGSLQGLPVVQFFFENDVGSVIQGFTIRGGYSGINCTSASPVIRGNIITRNESALGAGICCTFTSNAQILDNVIVRNAVTYHCCFPSRGGGIYTDDTSAALIRGNVVAFNRCNGECVGGGISSFIGTIENNTIVGNESDGPAGGVELPSAGAVFSSNIVVGNRSGEFGDGIAVFRSADLACNDVWGNGSENYWGTSPGAEDFSADPRFCGLPSTIAGPPGGFRAAMFDLKGDSPCLPENQTGGCDLIGARSEVCNRGQTAADVAPAMFGPALIRVYPNPTRSAVTIGLAKGIALSPTASLEILDAGGRVVARLLPDARGTSSWDGRTQDGRRAPAGLYFVRICMREGAAAPGSAPILVVR